jgi:hypothetical protein
VSLYPFSLSFSLTEERVLRVSYCSICSGPLITSLFSHLSFHLHNKHFLHLGISFCLALIMTSLKMFITTTWTFFFAAFEVLRAVTTRNTQRRVDSPVARSPC